MARFTLFVVFLSVLVLSKADGDEKGIPDNFSQRIDDRLEARLKPANIPPSPPASDAEFLRRVYLDLHGVVPTANRVKSFLDDRTADKRAKVIDELLADPRFAEHLADIWDDYLLPDNDDTRSNRPRFKAWLQDEFQSKPWDQIALDLLTATGQRDKDPGMLYLLKSRETLSPAELTDLVSQYFVGIRLNCAQCHDHPFTIWKQTDYWGLAAFFTEIQYTDRRLQKSGLIRDDPAVAVDKLEHAAQLRTPKFLGGEELVVEREVPHRQALARWLTTPDNPYFARAMVNRMWAQFFGRGLVNPVDDMHQGNEPTHPELLSELSAEFAASSFDLRKLCRAICNTSAYQRTSMPVAGNEGDAALYSHMAVKVLTPEQLYDSLAVVLPPTGERKGGRIGNPRDEFVQFFRSEGDPNPLAYDRGIPQALRLMNSSQFLSPRVESDRVRSMFAVGATDAEAIDGLYLHVLARRPTDDERKVLDQFLSAHPGERDAACAEIVWALMNSSEFSLNR
jgi:hypothetical protein